MDHQRMLERFDTDGDGQLSPEEREAARASMPPRGPGGPNRQDWMKQLDTDGDGIISEDERAAARAARKGPPPPPPSEP